MRKKKASIMSLIALVLIVVVCIVFMNKDSSYEQETENEIEGVEEVEQIDEGLLEGAVLESEGKATENTLEDILIKHIDANLNVRELPQHNSNLVGVVENFYTPLYYYGESAQGYGSDNVLHTWYRVDSNSGVSGWVRSDFVISQDANIKYPYESDNAGSDYVKFTDDTLNIRSEPSHNSRLVGKVTDCNTYLHHCYPDSGYELGMGSDGEIHGWIKVIVNSKLQGWVREDLVIETSAEVWYDNIFVKKSSTSLNVRALPQHDSALVMSIQNPDTKLYYNGVCESGYGSDGLIHDWYEVDVSSTERGWVRSDLVMAAPNV